MTIAVMTICKNEAKMMPFFLRHYSSFADAIFVWDEQSCDGTRDMVGACPKATICEWRGSGLNDEEFLEAVNTFPKKFIHQYDWVIFADVDELLYHPDIAGVLAEAKEDMIRSTGYALINPDGFPDDDGRQLYEIVRTGISQPNYNKLICWRPHVHVEHTIGRHTYDNWPKCSGKRGAQSKLKLLHCHHVGGAEHTRQINQRNYDRAVDKKFAWNYTDVNDRPEQVGTVAWVRDAIENGKLVDVMAIPDYQISK